MHDNTNDMTVFYSYQYIPLTNELRELFALVFQ